MRADRLLAALLVLQARGRVTAASLAAELEISERTARRDLEALATAGVPVYSQAGRNGGWSLVGGARTDLTGLTAGEVRALFLLTGSSSSTPELRTALRKLTRALPATFRAEAERASATVVVDTTGWDRARRESPPHLGALQQAVIDDAELRLHYRRADGTSSERLVAPLGLVTKRGVWYLVAGTEAGQRTFRLDRIVSAERTGETSERPAGFDLEASWRETLDRLDDRRLPLVATVRVAPELVTTLRAALATPAEVTAQLEDGRLEVTLRSYNARMLGSQLAGFGRLVELVGPEEVRAQLRRLAGELAATYLEEAELTGRPGLPGRSGSRRQPGP